MHEASEKNGIGDEVDDSNRSEPTAATDPESRCIFKRNRQQIICQQNLQPTDHSKNLPLDQPSQQPLPLQVGQAVLHSHHRQTCPLPRQRKQTRSQPLPLHSRHFTKSETHKRPKPLHFGQALMPSLIGP